MIGGGPDGQRCTPVTGPAQVPVHQVFQPVAEATGPGRSRFPVDLLIALQHFFLVGRGADEPGIKGVVEDGFIGAPAMRIAVGIFFCFEGFVFLLQLHNDIHIHAVLTIDGILVRIIFILDVAAGKLTHFFGKHPLFVDQGQ